MNQSKYDDVLEYSTCRRLGGHFRLSLWSEMFFTRVCIRKPTRITTLFQITALVVSWAQGNERVWIEGIESVRVLQLLRGRKHHEQVSYRSKDNKYIQMFTYFQIFCWLLACISHLLIGLFHYVTFDKSLSVVNICWIRSSAVVGQPFSCYRKKHFSLCTFKFVLVHVVLFLESVCFSLYV